MLRKFQSDQEYYASLPRKRVGACVLLFYKGDLLIVQPTYAQGWIIPGGAVESEESPLECLHREVKEELGLLIHPGDLWSIDYIANLDVKGEYIQFLFSARDLSESQVQGMQVKPAAELKDFQFVSLEKAYELLTPAVARRVASTMESRKRHTGAVYLENGRPLNDYLRLAMADL